MTPSVDVDLEAIWWDFTGSWERTKDSSTEDDQETTVDTTWDLEWIGDPDSEAAPSAGFAYQRDKDEEAGLRALSKAGPKIAKKIIKLMK